MLTALTLLACTDPPDPPLASHATASTARWVEWKSDATPVEAPVVLFVDAPGGPVDRLAGDSDVTTFLNDRFHPVFRTAFDGQAAGTVRFYDACGCALTPPSSPRTPAEFVDLANAVIVRPESRRCRAERLRWDCVGL